VHSRLFAVNVSQSRHVLEYMSMQIILHH